MIAMANASLLQLTPKQQSAIPTLALQRSREAVKRRLAAQGIKISLTPSATITKLAEEYADAHRDELLPQAIARAVRIWPVQNSKHSIRKRRPDPKAELLCRNQVRNGAEQ